MKTLVATLTLAALIASPILAQAAPRSQAQQSEATGQERTCGFPVYQYDSEGTPTGPYCH